MLDALTFDNCVSPNTGGSTLTYGYTQLKTPATAAFRELNAEYTPKEADREKKTVDLKIFGGSFQVDRVLANTTNGQINEVDFQLREKINATINLFHYTAINGDKGTTGFDGMDKMLVGTSTELNIVVPRHSTENRRYVPFGFIGKEMILTDAAMCIPNATIYEFGILESNVHMAWTRAVCGRIKSDYRYSKDVVYNNFPWPTPTDAQKTKIEETAQAILDARALYPDSSLADLYDETTMPPELRKAHQQNDKAVMRAYGFDIKTTTETSCVAELMRMYQKLTEESKK